MGDGGEKRVCYLCERGGESHGGIVGCLLLAWSSGFWNVNVKVLCRPHAPLLLTIVTVPRHDCLESNARDCGRGRNGT
jgi:hypothetical protein